MTNEQSEKSTIFASTLEQEKQIVSALNMVGAGFEAKGGSSLMLTEAVENGVDAIIEFTKRHKRIDGEINVIIDKVKKQVLVIDNGIGFLDVKHVCEKPFDSLKIDDENQTGKFARGLQGFRAFCHKLTYITKRKIEDINEEEKKVLSGKISSVLKIEFLSNTNKVAVSQYDPSLFDNDYDLKQGTVAIYEDWKPGIFEEINITALLKRLQHHFGELIRKGNIKIGIEVKEGKIAKIGPEQAKFQYVEPRDYSEYTSLNLSSINFKNIGKIEFHLYLSDKGAKNRWNYPYLLYKGRPVGDGFVAEIDEFNENPIWKHKFLTGYITCDFCEINELRQGLKNDDEGGRDFLFKELLKMQTILEKKVKEHSNGLYELRLQKQVEELVKDLQTFFKNKNIFNFKIAKSSGFLSNENNEIEIVQLAKTTGENPAIEVKDKNGTDLNIKGEDFFDKTSVVTESFDGDANKVNPDIGGHSNGTAQSKFGSAGSSATEDTNNNTEGFKKTEDGYKKPQIETNSHKPGGNQQSKTKGTRHKPRGFGLVTQDDEFNEDLSWFDEISSVVIINSQHPRYLARYEAGESQLKSLMDYFAELYIWEITKLVHSKDDDSQKGMKFLDYKFEYAESVRNNIKTGKYTDE